MTERGPADLIHRRRNEVERTINRLKNFRAAATRFGKRAYVFHGTVAVAADRLGAGVSYAGQVPPAVRGDGGTHTRPARVLPVLRWAGHNHRPCRGH